MNKPQVAGTVREPSLSYAYTLDKAESIPEMLKGKAGIRG
jgi:hypothetical protein